MKKFDVAHFLSLYTLRMKMQESGVTKPTKEGKKFTKEFVEKLSQMPPDEEVQIIDRSFVDSKGNIIAKLPTLEK